MEGKVQEYDLQGRVHEYDVNVCGSEGMLRRGRWNRRHHGQPNHRYGREPQRMDEEMERKRTGI